MKTDTIIIGSGVSGLATAILLAKTGQNVLVLERHSAPGGLMQTFVRGDTPFPTGVHLLGSLDVDQPLRTLFSHLGVFDQLRLVRMNKECFLRFRFPSQECCVPQGHQRFEQSLISMFPKEKAGIEGYFREMHACISQVPYHTSTTHSVQIPGKYIRTPLASFLSDLTQNRSLQAILKAFSIFYGVAAEECPLFLHFVTIDSLLNSAWRVDDSFCSLATAFVNALTNAGGSLRTGAPVASIVVRQHAVRGVTLASGETLDASRVVYTGHPSHILSLVPNGAFGKRVLRALQQAEDTCGFFGVNMQWQGAYCPLSLEAHCHFTHENPDSMFVPDCPKTSLDTVFYSANPSPTVGGFSAVALCPTPYDVWKPWAASRTGRRPLEYRRLKETLSGKVVQQIQGVWPDQTCKVINSFSPLTLRDYTGSPCGSAYGLKRPIASSTLWKLAMPGPIAGLHMTGQSLLSPGIFGSIAGAVHCTSQILNRNDTLGSLR